MCAQSEDAQHALRLTARLVPRDLLAHERREQLPQRRLPGEVCVVPVDHLSRLPDHAHLDDHAVSLYCGRRNLESGTVRSAVFPDTAPESWIRAGASPARTQCQPALVLARSPHVIDARESRIRIH
jgi:hypothetical protein